MPSTFAGAWKGEVTLCQNWNIDEQREFWFLPQGSLILPYDWFVSLEQKDSQIPFIDPAYMNGFRYLPQQPTEDNPDGLPIGFTLDHPRHIKPFRGMSKRWLGLTCAACHTGQIEITKDGQTRRVLVDGAPTMADFQGFTEVLVEAMQATVDDSAKFDRFFAAVMKRQDNKPSNHKKKHLNKDFKEMPGIRRAWNARNKGEHAYGFARLDAIGAIMNEVASTAIGLPDNHQPANAPVSYPYLWDTPHYDRVQWNGSIENKGPGALARNVGEVLGVFGGLKLRKFLGHRSSVNTKNLGRLEQLISTLQPPKWPQDILGPIDLSEATQTRGRKEFETRCLGCHMDTKAPGVMRPFKVKMMKASAVGTDPAMATNFAKRMSLSGKLAGRKSRYVTGDPIEGPKALNNVLLGYAVVGTLTYEALHHLPTFLKALKAGKSDAGEESTDGGGSVLTQTLFDGKPTADKLKQLFSRLQEETRGPCEPAIQPCYKARSLNGIWATAPYLHNGSVRTMRQLLLPVDSRQKTFSVGSREFDPEAMGFKNEGEFELDTELPGNLRTGHEGLAYGNQAFKDDPELLRSILEYLKTL